MPLTDKLATSPEEKTLFTLEEQSPESKETDSMGNLNFIFNINSFNQLLKE